MDLPDVRIWSDIEPAFKNLVRAGLTRDSIPAWLERWSEAEMAVWGTRAELKAARARAPGDEDVRRRYVEYQEHVMPPYRRASQALAVKLLAVPGREPLPIHAQMMRRLRNEANLPLPDDGLAAHLASLEAAFDAIYAEMTVSIDDQSLPMPHADALLRASDRAARERAWRAIHARWMAAREPIDEAFVELVSVRRRVAQEAGMEDFRASR
jgi:oligoendopeptidase F